ncbi:MAG: peptidoglycan binding protein CsiV [Candidatus Thiodiazotropha sp. (ex Myrtea spinifera)]|nr:peptidoglycan binding protein CsiV [Candidatus Thiodiazotropha sp. (ex Myrtea spinifera)]MCU7829277.1 peptidoglycan binding protein CsiV [Candidatus Thiodiazotropha sp. (ex Myrtea sp. 'scaly one' KF741663)]
MKKLIPALSLGLLMALPFPLLAEQDETATQPPWYEFEVLIFQRIAKGAGSTEAWPDNPESPSLLNAIPFDRRGKATLRGDEPIAYRPLPASERRLNDIWTRFRNSRNYRPLYHVAWRQQIVNPEQAQQLYISLPPDNGKETGPMNPPKLEGTLKIGVKRYLHLETDLLLHLPHNPETVTASDDTLFMGPHFQSYRLQAQRRMRSGKLHYLDHPVLGVLVQAEKYVPPEPEPEPETETTPPVEETQPSSSADEAKPSEQQAPQR